MAKQQTKRNRGKSQTKRKHSKQQTKRRRGKSIKGGKCNCNKSFFGGNASHAPYELNTYDNDPSREIISTRILPNMTGGRKTCKKCKRKLRSKSMKGGNVGVVTGMDPSMINPISSFGGLRGSYTAAAIVAGNSGVDGGGSNIPDKLVV
jgi:hypothetical protein